MTCSPPPRSSASWRWRRCSPGLSSRRYGHGLEPAGQAVEAAGSLGHASRRCPAGSSPRPRPRSVQLMTPPPRRPGPGRVHGRRGAFRRAHLRRRARHRHRRDQAPAGDRGRLDRERHPGHGPDHRAARPRPGRDQAHPGGDRRVQGAVPRGQGRVRQAADPSLPAAQDPKCEGQAARQAAHRGGEADAPGLPRRLGGRGRGAADRAGPRAGPRPTPGLPPRCARAWPRR